MATSEGIPSSIDIEFLELNDNPYYKQKAWVSHNIQVFCLIVFIISHKYFYASNSLLLDNRHEPMTHA